MKTASNAAVENNNASRNTQPVTDRGHMLLHCNNEKTRSRRRRKEANDDEHGLDDCMPPSRENLTTEVEATKEHD